MVNKLTVEVAYAAPHEQRIAEVVINHNTTIEMAIMQSGLLDLFPEIDLSKNKVGVFGKVRGLADKVNHGDRIEIYRPLTIDPKDARRAKVKKKR